MKGIFILLLILVSMPVAADNDWTLAQLTESYLNGTAEDKKFIEQRSELYYLNGRYRVVISTGRRNTSVKSLCPLKQSAP